MATTTRIKSKANTTTVPQTRDDCAAQIRALGDLQRQIERLKADMGDQIATITSSFQPLIDALVEQSKPLQSGIQSWCEAHRVDLCGENDRLGKTANLITGEVSWRCRPPSVSIRGADTVLDTLHRMGLQRFIRIKEEPNKDAMLSEPNAVRGITGITINIGIEDFIIVPFQVEVQ